MASVRDRFKYSGEAHASDPAWRVVIALRPSRRAAAWITALAGAAVVAILAAALPWQAKPILVAATAVAMVRSMRCHGAREGPGAVRRLSADLAGRVEVEWADGRRAAGRLGPDSFVAPWLAVVRWVPDGARLSGVVTVLPDAVDESSFRRLRVLLRWR